MPNPADTAPEGATTTPHDLIELGAHRSHLTDQPDLYEIELSKAISLKRIADHLDASIFPGYPAFRAGYIAGLGLPPDATLSENREEALAAAHAEAGHP